MLIPGYTLGRKIKDGGFSSVYEARRIADGHHSAIKILSAQGVKEGHASAFRAEARLLMGLEHENVIRVHALITTAERPAYAMDYFDGMNLKAAVVKYAEEIRAAANGVLLHLSRGVAYLHEQGVVHRDLKPENILVSTDGDVRVIDFSIAFRDTFLGRLFLSRKIQGTPQYMAPEQILRRRITSATDVYALGCVFFEVITGKPLFVARTQDELVSAHLKTKPATVTTYIKAVPPKLSNLVSKMVSKKPDQRPRMAEVVDVLEPLALAERSS